MAMRILGVASERGMVVGDQIATDIAMGRNAGMATVLVLTGTSEARDVEATPREQRPDGVIDGIGDLIPWLDDRNDSVPPQTDEGS